MATFSVECSEYTLNGNTYTLGSDNLVETDNKEIRATFKIMCDGKEDNVSFNMDYYGDDDMVIEADRCNINLYIKENQTPFDKNFTITCTHANDRTIYLQIDIVQKAEIFELEITEGAILIGDKQYTKEMESIVQTPFEGTSEESNYNYYEEHEFKVEVKGGSKKYRVETILKCHSDEEDDSKITYHTFDKGFILNKFDDRFVIRNYGRPFLEDNDYYLIRLCHEDYREATIELMLTYSQVPVTRRRASSTRRGRKKLIQPQVSDIYLTYEEHLRELQPQEEETITLKTYEITFTEDVGDRYNVVGKQMDITLPFEVFEDGEPSNLLCVAHAYADWCTATTDVTNRNLIINILNKPMMERLCYVKVYIVDQPDVYLAFKLVNTI